MDIFDFLLYIGYVLMIGAVASAVILSILSAIKTPGALLKSLYGIGALIVLFLVCWAISSSDVTPQWEAQGISHGVSKFVGGGLLTFYVVIIAAVIGLVFSEVNKALK